ncbi:MAG: phage baseplate assembly protein V [Acidobacteriota bacterium]
MNVFDLLTDQTAVESRRGKLYGAVVGVVTNNQDPDGLGRVKVRFPWLSQEEESHWARVATLMAGAERGTWFLPEVDDEVLVLFEHGDPRFPYVIGGLWNGGDDAPRDNADGENNLRVITSRSGHELVFDDTSGAEQVEIRTAAGHRVLLDDSSGGERILIEDHSGANTVSIDSVRGEISIACQTKLVIESQVIEIKAGASLKVEAGAVLELEGALVKIN